jgi:signal peptidase complex subunit 3
LAESHPPPPLPCAANARKHRNIADATFVLKWNVMPYVGLLAYGDDASSGRIVLPRRSEVEKGAKVYY